VKLRSALQSLLAGWDEDLPASWRKSLGETRLNWKTKTLEHNLLPGELIFPGRKRQPLSTAPPSAHFLRAFDHCNPNKVRAVILGQDPYSNPAWATGRAFEQGNLKQWPCRPQLIADSLRRLLQVIVAARTGNPSYAAGDRAWMKLIDDVRGGSLQLESPRQFFDRLEGEGVIFLNTSLTISVRDRANAPKQCHRHFQLWAPFINQVLTFIATRQSGCAIYVLLGRKAGSVFDRSGAKTAAEHTGTWKRTAVAIRHFHPAAITAKGPAFLRSPNPFCEANDYLRRMGAAPISW